MSRMASILGVVGLSLLGSSLALAQKAAQNSPMTFFLTSEGAGEGRPRSGSHRLLEQRLEAPPVLRQAQHALSLSTVRRRSPSMKNRSKGGFRGRAWCHAPCRPRPSRPHRWRRGPRRRRGSCRVSGARRLSKQTTGIVDYLHILSRRHSQNASASIPAPQTSKATPVA